MNLLTNQKRKNHNSRLNELIRQSEKIILCSGWIKFYGLEKILSSIKFALSDNNADITIYSNNKHTDDKSINTLKELPLIKHIIVDSNTQKYLHSKIYYFELKDQFIAIIGSGNITHGGLVSNDEISLEVTGKIQENVHKQIKKYLNSLSKYAI